MSFLSRSTFQIWHSDTEVIHIDVHDTQYVKQLSWAKLEGTIITRSLCDLLSANQSNWVIIIIWAISFLAFYKTFLFSLWLLSFSSLHGICLYFHLQSLSLSFTHMHTLFFLPSGKGLLNFSCISDLTWKCHIIVDLIHHSHARAAFECWNSHLICYLKLSSTCIMW